MNKYFKYSAVSFMLLAVAGCSATQSAKSNDAAQMVNHPTIQSQPSASVIDSSMINLNLIMSDPDWLGRQPEQAVWSLDGQAVQYQRKQQGKAIKDFFQIDLSNNLHDNGVAVALSELHKVARQQWVRSTTHQRQAWVFESNIFVSDLNGENLTQLTRDRQHPRDLVWMTDGRLGYRAGNAFFAVDPTSGMRREVANWQFAEQPQAVAEAEDFIAKEQISLINYVALKRKQRQQKADYEQAVATQNNTTTAKPFYLPKEHQTLAAALSPKGDKLILVTRENKPTRQESDIMPDYIQEDGRIAAQKVRRRVADAEPESHSLWLLDLATQVIKPLSYKTLPGYNDDVLAEVKRENANAIGEDYQVNRLPRDIGILQSWYGLDPIHWHVSGEQVAIQLEAWDNKDRWIVTVDFDNATLNTQHRLSDEAWVNYRYNQFGWLNQTETLYFLSEQSGYSHLYLKPLDGKSRALTSGQYVVDDVTLSQDDQFAYFKANQKHPGIYEIYRVNTATGKIEALTALNGMTDYQLSPDESKLLLTHSKLVMPPELYVVDVTSKEATRLTHTVSQAFLDLPWVAPSIVPVPSSHTKQPIFSRVYLPPTASEKPRRAVIFNHGAGYLQNAHLGWSGYFREFMFHSLLAQQGYVVMDMDYRASAGYGRDWRTAIYRQMGTPEIQDLRDGVAWLTEHANVDRDRIGTYGGSYGGFMTFMALFTAPDLFQAGAALRPVSDWAHYNHGYTSNILNTPDVDPIAYRRSSPIYFAEGLQKPLLINAPMIDDNVFFVDVVRLVQRFIELEKEDFETAIYPVEPHGFVQPSSWLDEYRRIYKLFEENL